MILCQQINNIAMPDPITISFESQKIIVKISGSFNKERLGLIKQNISIAETVIKENSKKKGDKINILLDITEFDGSYDVAAMELMVTFAKNNTQFIKKTAVFGGSNKGVAIGKIIAALAERQNIKFFISKQSAENWLDG